MTKSRKKPQARKPLTKRPLIRRALYFLVMIMTGGTAGIGGWCFKDYPELQPLVTFIMGKSDVVASGKSAIKSRLATTVAEVLNKVPNRPGIYKVKINEVQLDSKQFSAGRTVDIQAQVRKLDVQGNESIVWESKTFGENLAVVGRDELTASWSNRPFEIEWRHGDQVVVEVWDRKAGFLAPKTFKMARPEPDTFPLASGPHALEVASRSRSAAESDLNRIVLDSQRTGDPAQRSLDALDRIAPTHRDSNGPGAGTDVAERPIIIR